jgi:hypothetical protein
MTDELGRSGEERIDDEGRNPTQRRIDEEGAEEAPVDAPWGTEDTPHEGEEGQDVV